MLCLFCLLCIFLLVQCAAGGNKAQGSGVFVQDIALYVQCLFTQLDLLQHWVQQQQELCDRAAEQLAQQQHQQQKASGGSRGGSTGVPEVQLTQYVAQVAALMAAVPLQTRAQAALRCVGSRGKSFYGSMLKTGIQEEAH